MKWSKRIGQWFGIEVRVHATFGLLLLWVLFSGLSGGGLLQALVSLALVVAAFTFVVLHEYGHALTARHFGVRTRGITLYPIGGVALLESMPKAPRHELLIALAGPAVNFVLAAGLWAGTTLLTGAPPALVGADAGLAGWLIVANLVMGTFNLIPALPMDGGRVLRAALTMRLGAPRATEIAAGVARVAAVVMGIAGLVRDDLSMLTFIAVFVWLAAGQERRMAGARRWAAGRVRAGVHRAQTFRAAEPGGGKDDGLHVVFGPDGRRLYEGHL